MNHWTDGCLVGEGGFLFGVVDCADGGKKIFFWVRIQEGLSPESASRCTSCRDCLSSFLLVTWAAGFDEGG